MTDITVTGVDMSEELDAFAAPVTMRSDFDTAYAAIARRSMRKAEMLDRNPLIAIAVDKVLHAIDIYCQIHDLHPEDLDVDAAMSFEGKIVVNVRRA
jgi:hypothetical protein